MNGMHTNSTMPVLAPVSKPSAKADMAHPSMVWMPAKMKNSWNRALKSLKTYPELSLTGSSLMVMAPLPGTKAALMLSLCSIPGRPPHNNQLKSLLKTGTSTLLSSNSALIPFPTLEAATVQHANTLIWLQTRSSRNPTGTAG
eukprot:1158365-Pelagomonas_calceolata.AAC.17